MNKTALILGLSLLPAAAMAAPSFLTSTESTDGPGYTYAQGKYIPEGTLDDSGHDYTGYGFKGSYQLPAHMIVQGSYDRLNVKDAYRGDSIGNKINRANIGLGGEGFYDYGGQDGTGVGYYGTVSYERIGFRNVGGTPDATGTGFGLNTGLRWMVDPSVEINPHASYVDYGKVSGGGVDLGSPDGFKYGMQVVGYLDDDQHVGLTAGYDRSDVDYGVNNASFHNEVNLGARYTF